MGTDYTVVRGGGSTSVAGTYRCHLSVRAKSDFHNLAVLWSTLNDLSQTYAKYSVLQVRVKVLGLVPTTQPAVIALGYDPQDENGAIDMVNVCRNRHHVTTTGNGSTQLVVSPQTYVEDWQSTGDPTVPFGAIEMAMTYAPTSNSTAAFITVEVVVAFAGLRM